MLFLGIYFNLPIQSHSVDLTFDSTGLPQARLGVVYNEYGEPTCKFHVDNRTELVPDFLEAANKPLAGSPEELVTIPLCDDAMIQFVEGYTPRFALKLDVAAGGAIAGKKEL